MQEIVQIQVGQCGNQMGIKFWDIVASEHGLSSEGIFIGDSDRQISGLPVFFNESTSGKFVPRAILIDLEPSVLDNIRNTQYGGMYRPDNFISGTTGASNNFAKGYYSDGSNILETVLEIIRKEMEKCANVQGFQIFHSICGGTGSGLGSLILNKITEEFPDRINCTCAVFPSSKISEVVLEPYNAILTMDHLIRLGNEIFVMDNEALFNICQNTLKLHNPLYGDLNHLISNTISGITTSLRFTGQLNADLRKLATNLVPYPRIHFFITSFAPLTSRFIQAHRVQTIHNIVQQVFDCHNIMATCDPRKGKYLSSATMFRGKMSMKDIDNEVANFQNKNNATFVEWIPNNVKTSACDMPPIGFKMSVTFIGNSTSIKEKFASINDLYSYMFQRKSFVHWYIEEGMEERDFQEAEMSLMDLIDDLQALEMVKTNDEVSSLQ